MAEIFAWISSILLLPVNVEKFLSFEKTKKANIFLKPSLPSLFNTLLDKSCLIRNLVRILAEISLNLQRRSKSLNTAEICSLTFINFSLLLFNNLSIFNETDFPFLLTIIIIFNFTMSFLHIEKSLNRLRSYLKTNKTES